MTKTRLQTHKSSARQLQSDSIEEQFGRRVVIIGDCWAYNGKLDQYGSAQPYKSVPGDKTHQIPAHRVAYQILVGDIPEDHVLHHTCENPGCVNPAHLEPMTNSDHLSHHQHQRASRT